MRQHASIVREGELHCIGMMRYTQKDCIGMMRYTQKDRS